MLWTSHTRRKNHGLNRIFFSPTCDPVQSVQSLSYVWPLVTPWIAACQASLSITNSWSLLKLMSIESVMLSTNSSSVISSSSCLQSFPASGSFPMSQFFAPGGQSIGASALPEALPLAQLLHCMLIVSQWFSCCFLHRTCTFRYYICVQIGKWNRSVVSDSLQPHGL